MREHEYTPLIPKAELVRVRKLWKRAHALRGWADHFSELDAAWERAVQGGEVATGWGRNFHHNDMTTSALQQLCVLIDDAFLGGLVMKAGGQ